MSVAIALRELAVRYPTAGKDALRGVSMQVQYGQITAVAGPNGSGKSTIVRTLLRRVPVRAGTIEVDGQMLASLDARSFAQHVAVVPQREEPSTPLLVREFIGLGRHARRGMFAAPSAADDNAISTAASKAGVSDALQRRTDELSGGEWQRVRIARALAQETRIIVLDEPTTFLDVAHEMGVFELLDSLAHEGNAVLLVSHQLNLVARFATHIVLLDHGIVAAEGTPDAVMRGEILEHVYHWPLVVTRDPAIGAPSLLPLRGSHRGSRP